MSYAPIENPPAYSDNPDRATVHNDDVPDDFKYDTIVSGCELPIRFQFIKKVYSLVFLQLLTTGAIGLVIYASDTARNFALTHTWALIVSAIGSFAFMLGAYIQARKYPVNLFLLAGFTIFEGYLIGFTTALFDTNIVLEAITITLVVFIGLTLFAFQTKYDFISWISVLNTMLFAMIGIGFIWLFFQPSNTSEVIYSAIGAIVFSGYILVDTQLIMRRFNVEDEVPAAISLYLDVINLFLNILRILANNNDN